MVGCVRVLFFFIFREGPCLRSMLIPLLKLKLIMGQPTEETYFGSGSTEAATDTGIGSRQST